MSLERCARLGILVVITIHIVSSLDLFSTMDLARDSIIKHSTFQTMGLRAVVVGRGKSGSTLTSSAVNHYSNKFLQVLNEIERGIAEGSQRGSRNSQQKLKLLKTSIQEAVKKKMYQFARNQLGRAFYLIHKNASTTGRSRRHRRASVASTVSTFVRDIKTSLPIDKYDEFFAVDGEVTLTFAIDTTGSMADEIAAAKQIAIDVINIKRNKPVNYILSPFGDPEMGPITFRDKSENASFVSDINNLKAKGGGDCPELTFQGIREALNEAPETGSPLYVFTDASAKDNDLVDDVIDFAMNLDITVNFFITGSGYPCRAGDTNFAKLAQATSGRVLRFKNANEMLKMSNYIGKSLPGFNIITTGSSPLAKRKRRSSGNKTYKFPIDESVETMLVCFNSDTRNDGRGVVLKDPSGTVITSEKVSLSTTTLYEIKTPEIGQWSLQISPSVISGKYTFDVKSTSEAIVDFSHYFLVTIQRPRSKVEIYTSNPIIGKSSELFINVVGAGTINRHTLKLELITEHNQHIQNVNLTSNDTDGKRYIATFLPPTRPLKLKIKGITKHGNPFERISHYIIQPKSVLLGLFFCKTENTIKRGGKSTTVFRLYNAAPVDKDLVIKVRDKRGFAQPLRRTRRRIRRGRMGFFSVSFRAPTNVAIGTDNTATVIVLVNNGEEKLIETIQMNVIP
ncbi:von Willebrand factor A domain-containing protein 7-like [Actinia tenebrosa]|uniref:von Willebrand factor A domain-containing protein 7-like n=1 Tax=Actinia tenebrosa TaxID=6105 RepID=A0A6P8IP82_ACTTE|nr:von Willebrand factor A domain-containing protein 7-like [Actinia tenebrosa]